MSKFIIRALSGGYVYSLKASNGQIIATGAKAYSSREACKEGIEALRRMAPIAALENHTVSVFKEEEGPKFEMYKLNPGEFKFIIKDASGSVMAVSELYKAKANCLNGIESVRKYAPDAQLIE